MFAALTNVVAGLVIMGLAWGGSDRRHGVPLLVTGWCVGCLAFAAGLAGLVTAFGGGRYG